MLTEYEKNVQKYCGNDWRTTSVDDKNGGYGIACVIAYLDGTEPIAADLAKKMATSPDDIIEAFENLKCAGVFSEEFDAREDDALKGDKGQREFDLAWGQIAGIASGLVYRPASNSFRQAK